MRIPSRGNGKLYVGDELICDVEFSIEFSSGEPTGGSISGVGLNQAFSDDSKHREKWILNFGQGCCMEITLQSGFGQAVPGGESPPVKWGFLRAGIPYECE